MNRNDFNEILNTSGDVINTELHFAELYLTPISVSGDEYTFSNDNTFQEAVVTLNRCDFEIVGVLPDGCWELRVTESALSLL